MPSNFRVFAQKKKTREHRTEKHKLPLAYSINQMILLAFMTHTLAERSRSDVGYSLDCNAFKLMNIQFFLDMYVFTRRRTWLVPVKNTNEKEYI